MSTIIFGAVCSGLIAGVLLDYADIIDVIGTVTHDNKKNSKCSQTAGFSMRII